MVQEKLALTKFPPRMALQICSFLGNKSLRSLAAVSKEFKVLAEAPRLWTISMNIDRQFLKDISRHFQSHFHHAIDAFDLWSHSERYYPIIEPEDGSLEELKSIYDPKRTIEGIEKEFKEKLKAFHKKIPTPSDVIGKVSINSLELIKKLTYLKGVFKSKEQRAYHSRLRFSEIRRNWNDLACYLSEMPKNLFAPLKQMRAQMGREKDKSKIEQAPS